MRSGYTRGAAASPPRQVGPCNCASRRIRTLDGPPRAQQALGVRNQGVQSCGEVYSGGAQRAHLESLCGPSTPHQATPLRAQTHQSPHTGQRVDSKRSACATRECRAAARCRAPRRGGCAQRTHFEGFEGHCGPSTPRHATPLHTRTPQRPLHAQQALGRSQTLGSKYMFVSYLATQVC